jgi:hypothetical protein
MTGKIFTSIAKHADSLSASHRINLALEMKMRAATTVGCDILD